MIESTLIPDDYASVAVYKKVPKIIHALAEKKHLFNRLTVKNASSCHVGTEIEKGLIALGVAMTKWSKILANPLAYGSETDEILEAVQNTFDIAVHFADVPFDEKDSPRPIFDLEVMESNYRKLFAIRTVLWLIGDKDTKDRYPMNIFNKAFNFFSTNYMNVLEALERVFFMPDDAAPQDIITFVLNEQQMFFTEAEKEEIRKEEEARELAEAKAKELEELRKTVKDHADLILKAYETHKQMGNLKKFELTDKAIATLKQQDCPEECEQVEALYCLLMAMGDTIRYMPGEESEPFECIMGSFMELENDVLSYNQMFQIYLGNHGLTHSKVVAALPMFGRATGKIVAQYVDTKEYLDAPNPELDKDMRTIHLFCA